MSIRFALSIASLIVATPAVAQMQDRKTSQTAEASAGRVGQRQTREQALPRLQPMERIANRIENRVQLRVRNRIDQNYDPQVSARSSFVDAGSQARTAGRSRRRR